MTPRHLALFTLCCAVAWPAVSAANGPWNRGIVYGRALLPVLERRAYWQEIGRLETEEEKRAFWEAHIERMQRLALERGVSIERPPNAPKRKFDGRKFSHHPYFQDLMTDDEQDAYRDAIWHINDDAERFAFVSAHILRMRTRALSRGVSYPGLDAYETAAVVGAGVDVENIEIVDVEEVESVDVEEIGTEFEADAGGESDAVEVGQELLP